MVVEVSTAIEAPFVAPRTDTGECSVAQPPVRAAETDAAALTPRARRLHPRLANGSYLTKSAIAYSMAPTCSRFQIFDMRRGMPAGLGAVSAEPRAVSVAIDAVDEA